jgi:type I restriction enzyme M protein
VVQRRKYKMDLIPPPLIVARFFATEQSSVNALEARRETEALELEDFAEEHGGEEGLVGETKNEKGKVTRSCVKELLDALVDEPDSAEERDVLSRCLQLMDAETVTVKAIRDAQAALNSGILAHYAQLTESEIKVLVIDDKWLAALNNAIGEEAHGLTQALANRVLELEERYATSLPELDEQLAAATFKVEAHLRQMGYL